MKPNCIQRYSDLKEEERVTRCAINDLKRKLKSIKLQITEIEEASINQIEIAYDKDRHCHHEIRDGYHVMINNFTGTVMTWEDSRKKIPVV